MENNALIVAEKLNPVEIFTGGGLKTILNEIQKKVDDFEPDLSTAATRKEIASMAHRVSRSKVLIDDLGKSLVAEHKKKVKTVDTVRKEARDFLDNLRDEVREPLSSWEAEEDRKDQERIAAIKERMKGFPALLNNLDGYGTVEELKGVIAELEATEVKSEEFFEFTAEANQVRTDTLKTAHQCLENRKRRDREKAEQKKEAERLAAERKEQAEKEAELKAAQDKIDAENRKIAEEKAELERAKKADQERRDREKFEREAKERAEVEAREKAERIEQERIDKAKAEADEQERQEALKPDKEKLIAFALTLQGSINYPEVSSDDAQGIIQSAHEKILWVSEYVIESADKL